MPDNALQSVQKLLQDLIAPDVRETKARLETLEKRMDAQFEASRRETSAQFESLRRETSAQFESSRRETEAHFAGVDAKFGGIDSKFAGLDSKFGGIDSKFDGVDTKFVGVHGEIASLRREMEANFAAVLSAISEMKAHAENISVREVASLRERIAVLEAQQSRAQ